MIKALIFDFDGLILDTEAPDYQAWQEIYREYGQELSVNVWGRIIGGTGFATFDAIAHLEGLVGRPLDGAALNARWRARGDELIAAQPILPGVEAHLGAAQRQGLRLAIASSSSHEWVDGHLARLGLLHYFEVVKCADDVQRAKPDPQLFLAALAALAIQPGEAIVYEDSPNGVKAAKTAGIFVVAVPNSLTGQLSLDGADLLLPSLASLSLEELLQVVTP